MSLEKWTNRATHDNFYLYRCTSLIHTGVCTCEYLLKIDVIILLLGLLNLAKIWIRACFRE